MRTAAVPLLLLALSAAPAAHAADCYAALPPGARLIYDGALPKLRAGATMRDALTEVTKGLIADGRIAFWNASPAAHKAADCLDQRPK
jgi:hypothetical protein